MMLRIELLVCALLWTQVASAQNVRIGVLGLFRPHEITVTAEPGQALIIQTESLGKKTFALEKSSGTDTARIAISGDGLVLRIGSQSLLASHIRASSRTNGAADFALSIPGKISRRYHGVLELKAGSGILLPVVQMDLETAVGSVVQAESAPDAPLETLKAQAVATRSYFVASQGRHHNFDFCDTTHCQFLREPPLPGSNAFRAAVATRGLVLAYQDHAVAAMFTRSCSGRTRTPQEVGLSSHGYPYFPAVCDHCLSHPLHWLRRVSQDDVSDLRERGEASRLDLDRRLGWSAVPSNNFVARIDATGAVLEGKGEGHGIGLCQAGAKAMAQSGATYQAILDHYYPNTTLVNASAGWSSSALNPVPETALR